MSKRENPMAVRSKNAFAQSLLALMMKQPFDSISISDIADRSGLARQTFYTNFNKKEDILNYMLKGLFQRYGATVSESTASSSALIIDYFLFWDKSKDFLSLLFKQGLGHLFQECNRQFFAEEVPNIDILFDVEEWQFPYIRASIAGITYELLYLWIAEDMGLSINTLSTVADNLLSGKLFSTGDDFTPELIF